MFCSSYLYNKFTICHTEFSYTKLKTIPYFGDCYSGPCKRDSRYRPHEEGLQDDAKKFPDTNNTNSRYHDKVLPLASKECRPVLRCFHRIMYILLLWQSEV